VDAARFAAVLSRCGQARAHQRRTQGLEAVAALAGDWVPQDDLGALAPRISTCLAHLAGVVGWQLLMRGPGGELAPVAARAFGSDGSPAPPWPPPSVRGGGAATEWPLSHRGRSVGVLRVAWAGADPGPDAEELVGRLGSVLAAALAGWSHQQQRDRRQARRERAWLSRLQQLRTQVRELERTQQAQADYVRAVAEDLDGPVSVVQGQAQLLQRGLLGEVSERMERSAQAMLRQGRRLGELAERLRTPIGRGDDAALRRDDVALADLVGDIAEKRGWTVDAAPAARRALVFADRQQLGEALQVLFGATAAPGLVRIERQPGGLALRLVGDVPLGAGERELVERAIRYHGGLVAPQPEGGWRVSLPALDDRRAERSGLARVAVIGPTGLGDGAAAHRFALRDVGPDEGDEALADCDAVLVALGPDGLPPPALVLGRHPGLPVVVVTAWDEGSLRDLLGVERAWTRVSPLAGDAGFADALDSVLAGRGGPPLGPLAFRDRLGSLLRDAPASWLPLSLLQVDCPVEEPRHGALDWLRRRTRSADVVGVDGDQLRVQLPGAPAHVAERLARGLAEALKGADLRCRWLVWDGEEEVAADELLSRLGAGRGVERLPGSVH
jgi:hypothetical protein